jgi:hypothetical protein
MKTIDVLVNESGESVTLRVKGYGGYSKDVHHSVKVSPIRAALMLSIFNRGRDCYWDDKKFVFSTNAASDPGTDVPSPFENGRVDGWEVNIPASHDDIEFLLSLVHDKQQEPTSGSSATGFARIVAPEDRAVLVLSIITSRYCYHEPNSLRNTGIQD